MCHQNLIVITSYGYKSTSNSAKNSDCYWCLHYYIQYIVTSATVLSGLDCTDFFTLFLFSFSDTF